MQLIKKINNNFVIARDKSGKLMIANGKGLGFGEFPREVTDLSLIERCFYNIDYRYNNLISTLPEETLKVVLQLTTILKKDIVENKLILIFHFSLLTILIQRLIAFIKDCIWIMDCPMK